MVCSRLYDVWPCTWCVLVYMVCGTLYGVYSFVLCVVIYMVCRSLYVMWGVVCYVGCSRILMHTRTQTHVLVTFHSDVSPGEVIYSSLKDALD